ncbi:hypothetical protein ACFQX4_11800 [Roseomonas sp. GCM10028921]
MTLPARECLTHAVSAVCREIADRIEHRPPDLTERHLWWELSCCLLSSQVPYSLAVAAANSVGESGLLMHSGDAEERLAVKLTCLLSTPLKVNGRTCAYRFPRSRAYQLAATRSAITHQAGELGSLLAAFANAARARDWFVRHAPGIGPKQASMFLRNAGVSYDLAILDRHVLVYMTAIGLSDTPIPHVSRMGQYLRQEETLRTHACHLGHPVGLLDWAIWIVMRIARGMP